MPAWTALGVVNRNRTGEQCALHFTAALVPFSHGSLISLEGARVDG